MKSFAKLGTAIILLVVFGYNILLASDQPASKKVIQYQCIPCGYDCDKEAYDKPGTCKTCHMKLVDKSTVSIKNVQPNEICNYIKTHPGIVLLDVRTKEEFEDKADPNFGGLRNSINLPVQELESKISTISQLKK